MPKKSENNVLLPKTGVQEIKYDLSWKVKFLLFFTFPLWIVPFLIISLVSGIRCHNALERFPKNGLSSHPNYFGITLNSLEFYNHDMEVKNASLRLMINGKQWQEMNPEDILIPTFDNKTLATFIIRAKKPTDKWVIVCHGWAQNRYSILYLAVPFYRAGYNILVYDFRNHGSNPDSSCTFGIKEAQDLFFVVKYLNERIDTDTNKKIALIGNSMGATTILQALQTFDLIPLGVVCAIFDCGYDDFSHMMKIIATRETNLHWFWSYYGIKAYLLWKDKFNISDIKPINKMKFCAKTPILFIQGLMDQTVPVSMVKNLYEAKVKYERDKNGFSKLLLVPNAGHIEAITTDYDLYAQRVLKFVNLWMHNRNPKEVNS